MKKNKVIASCMAAAILALIPSGIHAASDQEGTITLNAKVPSTYELSIPITSTDIDYDQQTQQIGKLSVSGNIEANKTVSVSVKEKKNFKTASNPADTTGIPFKITKEGKEFMDEVWTTDEIRAATPKEILLFIEFESDAWTLAHSGDYVGSVIFSAEMN